MKLAHALKQLLSKNCLAIFYARQKNGWGTSHNTVNFKDIWLVTSFYLANLSVFNKFLCLQALWNWVLIFLQMNNEKVTGIRCYDSQQTEVFADTSNMKVNKKRTMPVEKQGEYESKR